MSLVSFQSALAYVIRSFDAGKEKNIDELARMYELSGDEKCTLDNLIHQQRLKAYSEELFLARWTIIREALAFLQPLIDFKAMTEFWEQDFELKSTNIIQEDLALRFVEYLATDPRGMQFISSNPHVFMPSLVRYLYAVFTFRHNYLPKIKPPAHSHLSGRYFEVVDLEYDVREYFAELVELDDYSNLNLKDPTKRSLKVLFIASDEVTEFRSFEIDEELANFLAAQLKGETDTPMVPCYDDLVDIGLCKPRGTKRPCCSKIH